MFDSLDEFDQLVARCLIKFIGVNKVFVTPTLGQERDFWTLKALSGVHMRMKNKMWTVSHSYSKVPKSKFNNLLSYAIESQSYGAFGIIIVIRQTSFSSYNKFARKKQDVNTTVHFYIGYDIMLCFSI